MRTYPPQVFVPAQLLLVSFPGYARRPAAVVRDVLLHAGLPADTAAAAAAGVAAREARSKGRNSKASGHGAMPPALRAQLHALYGPFVERFYALVEERAIRVSPCEAQGTRFLDASNASEGATATGPAAPRGGRARRALRTR